MGRIYCQKLNQAGKRELGEIYATSQTPLETYYSQKARTHCQDPESLHTVLSEKRTRTVHISSRPTKQNSSACALLQSFMSLFFTLMMTLIRCEIYSTSQRRQKVHPSCCVFSLKTEFETYTTPLLTQKWFYQGSPATHAFNNHPDPNLLTALHLARKNVCQTVEFPRQNGLVLDTPKKRATETSSIT